MFRRKRKPQTPTKFGAFRGAPDLHKVQIFSKSDPFHISVLYSKVFEGASDEHIPVLQFEKNWLEKDLLHGMSRGVFGGGDVSPRGDYDCCGLDPPYFYDIFQ